MRRFQPHHTIALAALVAIISGVNSSRGSTIIAQTGFNDASGINSNGTPGSPYLLGSQLTAAGNGTGESGWTSAWLADANASGARSVIQTSPVTEGDQSLRGTSLGTGANQRATFYREFTPQTAGIVEWKLDFNVTSYGTAGDLAFYIQNVGGTSTALMVSLFADGRVDAWVGNGNDNGGGLQTGFAAGTISTGSWYELVINANMDTNEYNFSINGTDSSLGNMAFRVPSVANVGRVRLWNNTTNGSISYDNLSVSIVPEPNTCALLGMSLVGLATLSRKQRRRVSAM